MAADDEDRRPLAGQVDLLVERRREALQECCLDQHDDWQGVEMLCEKSKVLEQGCCPVVDLNFGIPAHFKSPADAQQAHLKQLLNQAALKNTVSTIDDMVRLCKDLYLSYAEHKRGPARMAAIFWNFSYGGAAGVCSRLAASILTFVFFSAHQHLSGMARTIERHEEERELPVPECGQTGYRSELLGYNAARWAESRSGEYLPADCPGHAHGGSRRRGR